MSTEDERTQGAYYTTGDSSATTQNLGTQTSSDSSFFDDDNAYSSTPATNFPGFDEVEDDTKRRKAEWHGGLDFGLLVLRVAIGGLFVAHGTDKLFGWFNEGMGMQATREMLQGFGFTEPGALAWAVALSETVGGVLLILGLFFPAGAAAVLGVMANVIAVKADWNLFLGDVELEITYAVAAFALLFTGPGRIAIDRHTHWWRKAPAYGVVFLIIAAGLSVVTLVVFR